MDMDCDSEFHVVLELQLTFFTSKIIAIYSL
jgi:hypothetical protein